MIPPKWNAESCQLGSWKFEWRNFASEEQVSCPTNTSQTIAKLELVNTWKLTSLVLVIRRARKTCKVKLEASAQWAGSF
ncbi:MAG: hypothetical protein ACTS80_02170 [Candidatus Hodgkinia cicadicola]